MGAAQNQGTVVELDLQHPYLRNCKTRTTASSIELLATIPSQLPTYKKWKEQLEAFTSSSSKMQYLLLPLAHKFDDGGVCSTSGQLNLQYEYYPRLLSSQIILRKKEAKKFTEGELWFLLYVLTMVKFELAENSQNIGDVHPRNIFLNETGDIKVACLRSWPGQVSNYRRAILQQQCGFLSPEDIERLKLGAMDNQTNTESQIFAIGLVILSSAALQAQHDLYEMRERQFEEDIFYSRLGKFQHDPTYSEIFRAVVSNLLQIEPLKRMNLQELKTLLEKHTENIVVKKPLRIDNVGKKLQKSISQMFKALRPETITEKPPQSKVPPPPPPPMQPVKMLNPGMRMSGEKIMNFISFEEKRPSQTQIPPPISFPQQRTEGIFEANSQTKLSTSNSFHSFIGKPPVPIPIAVTATSNEEPHRPTISKAFSSSITGPIIKKTESHQLQKTPIESPPKYKPFETISTKGEPQQQSPTKNEESNVLWSINVEKQSEVNEVKVPPEIKVVEESKVQEVGVERPTMTEIWMGQQTSIGKLNILMDTKKDGFDHNSLITPKYEPQSVEAPLESIRPSIQQDNEEEPAKEQEQEQVSEEKPVKEESAEYQSQKEESLIQRSLLKSSELSRHDNEERSLLKSSAKSSQISELLVHEQIPIESKEELRIEKVQIKEEPKQVPVQIENRIIEEPRKEFKVQSIELTSNSKSLSPTVKLFGMKTPVSTTKAASISGQNFTNVRELESNSEKSASQNDSQVPKQAIILESQVVRKESQIKKQPSKLTARQQDSEQVRVQEKPQVSQSKDYILIQQDSRHLAQSAHHVQAETQQQPSKVHSSHDHAEKQVVIVEQQSQIIQYHTYVDIATDGTFQECWQEILTFLKDPTEYTSMLDAEKVRMRVLDDRWSLKVGPGIFDIFLNKQEGKFLLRNCEESRCEGEMLGGVYKDEDKRHRIWFNSAYYYKEKKVPSREVIEDCLKKSKSNLSHSKK